MKKILLISLLFIGLSIGCYSIILIKKQSKNIVLMNEKNGKLFNNVETLKYNIIDGWSFERKHLNIDSIFEEDGKKIDTLFFEFEKPILVFRFSKIDCSDCIISQIGFLKKAISEKQINYMIIADYSNKRNLGLFKRANGITDHVYNCKELIKDENRTPYFCVYYKGIISNIFFPDNDFQELTEYYINKMWKIYFSE